MLNKHVLLRRIVVRFPRHCAVFFLCVLPQPGTVWIQNASQFQTTFVGNKLAMAHFICGPFDCNSSKMRQVAKEFGSHQRSGRYQPFCKMHANSNSKCLWKMRASEWRKAWNNCSVGFIAYWCKFCEPLTSSGALLPRPHRNMWFGKTETSRKLQFDAKITFTHRQSIKAVIKALLGAVRSYSEKNKIGLSGYGCIVEADRWNWIDIFQHDFVWAQPNTGGWETLHYTSASFYWTTTTWWQVDTVGWMLLPRDISNLYFDAKRRQKFSEFDTKLSRTSQKAAKLVTNAFCGVWLSYGVNWWRGLSGSGSTVEGWAVTATFRLLCKPAGLRHSQSANMESAALWVPHICC